MENYNDFNAPKIDLPNATIVLVLGIVSIVTCCCFGGLLGIICGIVAIVLAKSSTNLYISTPGKYTEGSYKNMNAGKACAWIGLILSAIIFLFMVWFIATVGINGLSDPNLFLERFGLPTT